MGCLILSLETKIIFSVDSIKSERVIYNLACLLLTIVSTKFHKQIDCLNIKSIYVKRYWNWICSSVLFQLTNFFKFRAYESTITYVIAVFWKKTCKIRTMCWIIFSSYEEFFLYYYYIFFQIVRSKIYLTNSLSYCR